MQMGIVLGLALAVSQQVPSSTTTAVHSKWSTDIYGFVEVDSILDSVQGLSDVLGNPVIAHRGTYTGEHGQLTVGARNSRIGLKLNAPTVAGITASAQLEMDFQGSQAGTTESAVFNNAVFRVRHMNLRLHSAPIDVLIGQYWQLFGWQGVYQPNTVAIQGIPGEVYSRNVQLRLSHLFKGQDASVEVALAALRPPQRASMVPDGQAGIRLNLDGWRGVHTMGSASTAVDPLSLGVSGTLRRFSVAEFSSSPNVEKTALGWGLSVDALVPVIPARDGSRGNSLTLTGSFVTGKGISDQYTGLTGGASFPALKTGTYSPNIDPGLVTFRSDGSLMPIHWMSTIVGVQYYLPGSGDVWFAANFSWLHSNDVNVNGPANTFITSRWYDADAFYDLTRCVRLGVEGSILDQTTGNGLRARDWRGQASALYLF